MRKALLLVLPLTLLACAETGPGNDLAVFDSVQADCADTRPDQVLPDGAPETPETQLSLQETTAPDVGIDALQDLADLATVELKPPCPDAPGTFSNQEFDLDGKPRFFFLHVPTSYDCAGEPSAVLIDLHGTAFDDFGHPEEAYRTTELKQLADEMNFIAVRPRSLSNPYGDYDIFQWDTSPTDIQENTTFVAALAQHLAENYHVDSARFYLSGFSSGTNQVAEILASHSDLFSGFAFVGGGTWTVDQLDADLSGKRFYLQTGYRDYMRVYQPPLLKMLDDAEVQTDSVWLRKNMAGHDLYGWQFQELSSFLDQGSKPEPGPPALPWIAEEFPADVDLLATAWAGDALVTCGNQGRCFLRDDAGWMEAARDDGWAVPAITGLCFFANGEGIAVGGGRFATTVDSGFTWTDEGQLPDLGGAQLGYTFGNGVACLDNGTALVVGYWSVISTTDLGSSWSKIQAKAGWESAPQAAAVVASGNQALATGFSYMGLYSGGSSMEQTGGGLGLPPFNDWFLGGAILPDKWVVVGDAGRIFTAATGTDKPQWQVAMFGGPDLFAVSFANDKTGAAVGDHGRVMVTQDSGATWQEQTGLPDAFLSSANWLPSGELIVFGEKGTVLKAALEQY